MSSEKEWFFTFGFDHCLTNGEVQLVAAEVKPGLKLSGRFVRFEGTYDEARRKMLETFGTNFAFQYPISDLPRQQEKFGLKELVLNEKNGASGQPQGPVESLANKGPCPYCAKSFHSPRGRRNGTWRSI